MGFLVAQMVKNPSAMQEMQERRVWSLGHKIPWRRKWLPTPVFLPGEFHGQRSLAGYSPWDCKESHMTELLSPPGSQPWDSPGKNTGVGCHVLLQCMTVKSESEVLSRVWLFATPWTIAYPAPPSMGFPRQEYWSGLPLPSLTKHNRLL